MNDKIVNSCDDPNWINEFDRGVWEDLEWLMPRFK